MQNKIRVGILFGGQSEEHEVSLQSAKNIIAALDVDTYEPVLIGIDRKGQWHLADKATYLLNETNPKLISLNAQALSPVSVAPASNGVLMTAPKSGTLQSPPLQVDVIFPILHGPMGEDGTIQGLLTLANIPFVGAGVLGSAVGMDKDVMKRLLRDGGLRVGAFLAIKKNMIPDFETAVAAVGSPLFVKPANLGSSVGVSKVRTAAEYTAAVEAAFAYDTKVLLEEYIECREIECGVLASLDGGAPQVSIPGEIIPTHEFYSYEAKYIDQNGARVAIPADLTADQTKEIQEMARKTFEVLCCDDLARVDFFLRKDGTIFVNEINTIPGFTNISMYPKLWEASGIGYSELIDRLLQLALKRAARSRR